MKIKNLLLIPALMGTMAIASDYNYEVTPVIGYNVAEGNLNLENEIITGLEAQYNGFDFPIKPEIAVLYSGGVKSEDTLPTNKTNITRFMLNGVYELEGMDSVVPFVKAGVGYETMNRQIAENTDGAFVDAGAGVKIPLTDAIALKVEALYMLKYNKHTTDNKWGDSNLALLAGVTFAFGEKAQKAAPVDGDDDNDGVKNSIDECLQTPPGTSVDTRGCTLDGDDDNDGVTNSADQCPTTEAGVATDELGCKLEADDDKDGVTNALDICPATPFGEAVNEDGCPHNVVLHIKFDHDSSNIAGESDAIMQKYADFLIQNKNYSAKIIGHTDSRGSAAYNQKLSQKRAKSVENMLIEKGAPATSLSSVGEGEANPMADNSTSEGRAHNRRIEAELTKN